MELKIKKLIDVKTPERNNPTDAGLDFFAPEEVIVNPHSTRKIPLGIAVGLADLTPFMPANWSVYMDLTGRSGKSTYNNYLVKEGKIDEGYIGEIGLIIQNNDTFPLRIKKGEKICQGIIIPVLLPSIQLVDELDETERGDEGFGSSDK